MKTSLTDLLSNYGILINNNLHLKISSMSHSFEDDFPTLIGLIYDAALDAERWPDFLDQISQSFDSAKGTFFVFDGEKSAYPFIYDYNVDPDYSLAFEQYYSSLNPYTLGALGNMPKGKVVYASEFFSEENCKKTEFYNDFLKPQNISTAHTCINLENHPNKIATFIVAPPAHIFDQKREVFASRLQLLAPHIVRAVELNRLTHGLRLAQQSLEHLILNFQWPLFIVDQTSHLQLSNSLAEELLRQGSLLYLDPFGCLHTGNSYQNAAFVNAISTSSQLNDKTGYPVVLNDKQTECSYLAWILPLTQTTSKGSGQSFAFVDELNHKSSMIIIVPIDGTAPYSIAIITQILNVTEAEAQLISALMKGMSPTEYAIKSRVSKNTVKNHLANIYYKTGTTRQAELVALAFKLLGPLQTIKI